METREKRTTVCVSGKQQRRLPGPASQNRYATQGGERIRTGRRESAPPGASSLDQQQEASGPGWGLSRGGAGSSTQKAATVSILYTNAQSINNKIAELTAVSMDLAPDLILITESWTNNLITDASLQIPGYDLETDLRRDRQDTGGGIGGGLLVYSKNGIRVLKIDHYDDLEFNQLCSFRIESTGTPMNIILLYRPPSSSADNSAKLCEVLRRLQRNTIVIGDFNTPGINWTNLTADTRGINLAETVEEENLDQLVNLGK